jgi:hypothetical protein
MSMFYRDEERDGVNRHPWDEPEGEVYEEDYSKKPVRSDKQAGQSHHRECDYDGQHVTSCMCYELYSRDYYANREAELEEMHSVWWQ